MHISLNEQVDFKGYIYKKSDQTDIDFAFKDRFFNFGYKESDNFSKFYVKLHIKQNMRFNVIFRANLIKIVKVISNKQA